MAKTTIKLKLPKERNPFVQHLMTKKSGAHGKSHKAERAAKKAAIRRGDYD